VVAGVLQGDDLGNEQQSKFAVAVGSFSIRKCVKIRNSQNNAV